MESIYSVTSVTPAKIVDRTVIIATGNTSSSGWSKPVLKARIYAKPPSDGIWEYDFTAEPPTGAAADVITPVAALTIWNPPGDAKGVRVIAKSNNIQALLASALDNLDLMAALGGDKPHPNK